MSCSTLGIPSSSLFSLYQIFNSTNGYNWHWKSVGTIWNFTNISTPYSNEDLLRPCGSGWQGLTCYSTGSVCLITGLNLSNYGLVGTIPSSISYLNYVGSLALNHNSISGPLPSSLGFLGGLQLANLQTNRFTGTLPTTLTNLHALKKLNLNNNKLTGTIPTEIYTLSNLLSLQLSGNRLHGSISSLISSLSSLQQLILDSNSLTSIIPPQLGSMSFLSYISCSMNQLNGPIPTELSSRYSTLRYLNLQNNHLSSTIPTFLGTFYQLGYLGLAYNNFNGSIPSQLGSLAYLQALFLEDNFLSSTIPPLIGLMNLKLIHLSNNFLTGWIPTSLASLSNLMVMDMFENELSGPIPTEFGLLLNISTSPTTYLLSPVQPRLLLFDIFTNHFTGTIPSSLSNLPSLLILTAFENYFTGTIPNEFGTPKNIGGNPNYMQSLMFFCFQTNSLTGSVPSSLLTYTNLQFFTVFENYLTGKLLSQPLYYPQLEYYYLYQNYFSGTVSSYFIESSSSMVGLDIHSNFFSGMFPLTSTSMPQLNFLVLRSNSFSGNLQTTFFNHPNLVVLSLSSNCFSGFLPSCPTFSSSVNSSLLAQSYSPNLLLLDLADLTSGLNCRSYLLPTSLSFGLTQGFLSHNFIRGGFPSCLFSLPSLSSLMLSGNGLTGPVDSSLFDCSTSKLVNLSLAANRLTGTIPKNIQSCNGFHWLDLSYNRFSGLFANGLQIKNQDQSNYFSVSVNRLSGELPDNQNLTAMRNIIPNVLAGNLLLFVESDLTGVPASQSSHLYSFNGSNNLNFSLYSSLGVLVGLFLLSLMFLSILKFKLIPSALEIVHLVFEYNEFFHQVTTKIHELNLKGGGLVAFIFFLRIQHRSVFIQFCVLIVITIYIFILKLSPVASSYVTVTEQSGWVISVSYLHGWLPIFLFVLTLSPAVALLFARAKRILTAPHTEDNDTTLNHNSNTIKKEKKTLEEKLQRFWKYLSRAFQKSLPKIFSLRLFKLGLLFLINLIAIFSLNAFYLIIVLSHGENVALFQFLMSIFKGGWNAFMLFFAKYWIRTLSGWLWFCVFVLSSNMILIPCLATILTQSSCLYPLFHQQLIPSSSYQTTHCDLFDLIPSSSNGGITLQCIHYQEISFVLPPLAPPFIYNYQCASALITNFTPVLIYYVIFSALLLPILHLFLCILVDLGWIVDSSHLTTTTTTTTTTNSASSKTSTHSSSNSISSSSLKHPFRIYLPHWVIKLINFQHHSHETDTDILSEISSLNNGMGFHIATLRLFHVLTQLASSILFLLIFFTFGVACPTLGVLVLLAGYCKVQLFYLIYGREFYLVRKEEANLDIGLVGGVDGKEGIELMDAASSSSLPISSSPIHSFHGTIQSSSASHSKSNKKFDPSTSEPERESERERERESDPSTSFSSPSQLSFSTSQRTLSSSSSSSSSSTSTTASSESQRFKPRSYSILSKMKDIGMIESPLPPENDIAHSFSYRPSLSPPSPTNRPSSASFFRRSSFLSNPSLPLSTSNIIINHNDISPIHSSSFSSPSIISLSSPSLSSSSPSFASISSSSSIHLEDMPRISESKLKIDKQKHLSQSIQFSLWFVIFVVAIFWSFQGFDMIGDEFGIKSSVLAFVVILLWFFTLCLIFSFIYSSYFP